MTTYYIDCNFEVLFNLPDDIDPEERSNLRESVDFQNMYRIYLGSGDDSRPHMQYLPLKKGKFTQGVFSGVVEGDLHKIEFKGVLKVPTTPDCEKDVFLPAQKNSAHIFIPIMELSNFQALIVNKSDKKTGIAKIEIKSISKTKPKGISFDS